MDLSTVVAALGTAVIGQVLDGASLIVVFVTPGAPEALATARTAESVRGLFDLGPATATRPGEGDTEEVVPAGRLRAGDMTLASPRRPSAPASIPDVGRRRRGPLP